MIRLLPIFHSWKCPGTGNLCSVTEDWFIERGEYKRGLAEQRSLRGLVYSRAGLFEGWFIRELVYSRAGLFISRAGLFWPHQWIPRISPNIKLYTTLSSLGEWLFTTQRRGSWEWDWPPHLRQRGAHGLSTRWMFSPSIFELLNFQYALQRIITGVLCTP